MVALTDKHGFAGFPVVAENNELVGIILVVMFASLLTFLRK
ncbi:hypothetical protein JCM19240_1529 [Vibrio maritimus]|uniref:CBS domain-containing protein n=1 Tax=Vibrio maritimus TaxID=990268 RepID=A0A090TZ03_9VIBR|nr:hypothetical protein JCM19240_1529 [Vibrio maritimus]